MKLCLWILFFSVSCECYVLKNGQTDVNNHRLNKRGGNRGPTVGASAPLLQPNRSMDANRMLCESCMRMPACKMSPDCRFCASICSRANIDPATGNQESLIQEEPAMVGQKAPNLSERFAETDPIRDYFPVGKLDSRNAINIICRMLGVKNVKDINDLLVLATTKSNQSPEFIKRITGISAPAAFKLPPQLSEELNQLVHSSPNGDVSNEQIDQALHNALNDIQSPDPQVGDQQETIPETNSRMGEEENPTDSNLQEITSDMKEKEKVSSPVEKEEVETNPKIVKEDSILEEKPDTVNKEESKDQVTRNEDDPSLEEEDVEDLENLEDAINENDQTLGKKFVHFSKGPHHSSFQSHHFFRDNEENNENAPENVENNEENVGDANKDVQPTEETLGNKLITTKKEPHHLGHSESRDNDEETAKEPLEADAEAVNENLDNIDSNEENTLGKKLENFKGTNENEEASQIIPDQVAESPNQDNMSEENLDEENVGIKNFHLFSNHRYDPHFRETATPIDPEEEVKNTEQNYEDSKTVFEDKGPGPELSSANQQLEEKSADHFENPDEEVNDNAENYPVINLEPVYPDMIPALPQQELYNEEQPETLYQEPESNPPPQPEPNFEQNMNNPENYNESPSGYDTVGEAVPKDTVDVLTEPPKQSLIDRLRSRLQDKAKKDNPDDVLGKKHVKFVMRPIHHKKFRDNEKEDEEAMPDGPKQEEAPQLMEEAPKSSAAYITPAKKYPEAEDKEEVGASQQESNPTVGSPESGIPGLDLAHGITQLVQKNLDQETGSDQGLNLAKDITKEVFKSPVVGAEENSQRSNLGQEISDLVGKNLNNNDNEDNAGIQLAKRITKIVGDELKKNSEDDLESPTNEEQVGMSGKDILKTVENGITSSKDNLQKLFHNNPLEHLENPFKNLKNPLENLNNPFKDLTGLPNIPNSKTQGLESEDAEEAEEEEEEGGVLGQQPQELNEKEEAVIGDSNPGQDLDLVANPDLANRNDNMDESASAWSNHFGRLMPLSKSNLFFIGNGIKLPLQMHKNDDGSTDLSVDLNKLCNCTSSCSKNQKAIEEAVGTILEKEAELQTQLNHLEEQQASFETTTIPENVASPSESPEILHNLRKRDLTRISFQENLRNDPVNHPAINYKVPLADKSKTKPRTNSLGNRLQSPTSKYLEKDDDVMQIKDMYKFRKMEHDLEDYLQRLNENVAKFNKDNELMLNKNVKKLFKANENEVIKQQVDIVSNVLEWMKNYAIKDRK